MLEYRQTENIGAGSANAALLTPNLFEYDNYRSFLQDYYKSQKQQNTAFSFRYFSLRAGYRSTNFLKLVMDGKRNLTQTGVARFIRALKFNPQEGQFFAKLVQFNQARSVDEKQSAANDIVRSKVYAVQKPVAKAKFEYWTKWHHTAIRELVTLEAFQEDAQWIASVLEPAISPEEAQESLQKLQDLGLLTRNPQGRLIQADADVTSGDAVFRESLAQFHRQMIERAKEAIDRFERSNRHISSVTLAINPQVEERLKKMIEDFRRDLVAVAGHEGNSSKIVQINLQLFPLTKDIPPCDPIKKDTPPCDHD